MHRGLFAEIMILALLASACGLKLPDQISIPTQITGGDPQTLEAATAADQERSDRYSSGDLAGAWLLSSRQFREGISQSDYVTYIQTCKDPGLPVKVVGVRMDGPDRAMVREELLGFKFSITMVYEDGHWLRAPDDEMAAVLGQPLDKIIASEKAAGHCDKAAHASAAMTTPSPTTEPPPPLTTVPGGPCSVDTPGCAGYDQCHPIVTGKIDCFPEDESCSKPGNNFPWCSPPPTCPTPGPGDEPQLPPPCTPDPAAPKPTPSGGATPRNGGPCDDYMAYVEAEPAWVVCDKTHHWVSTVYPKPTGWGSAVGSSPCDLPFGATVSNDGRMIVCEHSIWTLADY